MRCVSKLQFGMVVMVEQVREMRAYGTYHCQHKIEENSSKSANLALQIRLMWKGISYQKIANSHHDMPRISHFHW